MSGKESLASMVGSYDNLHEPVPLSNKPATILGALITLQILAWICALLRLWTRVRVLRAPGWDDLFVVLSLMTTTLGTTVICLGSTSYGLGKHFILLGGLSAMSDYLKGFYVAMGSYVLSTTFTKMALLLQYLRIFERGSLLYRFSLGMATVVGLWGLAFTIVAWFPCSPISDYWSLDPDAKCWGFASQDPTKFQITFQTHTAFNMVFDLIVLCIPIHLYFYSDMVSKSRWGLLGVLLLGAVANFASIWRLVTIVEHKAATWPTFDPSWYGCASIVLAAVEVDMAVVCASVPVFWPVLHSTGFEIFITKEVQVTSESRLRSIDGSREGIELRYAGAMPAGAPSLRRQASVLSKAGSEVNLHQPRSGGRSSEESPAGYYDDKDGLGNADAQGDIRWTKPGTKVNITATSAGKP